MIAPTTPPAPSVPLPRIYEDDSGRCWEEYMPPRYIPLPPIHEDDSGRCHAGDIPPPPFPFRYIPLPPIHEDDSGRCPEYIPPPPLPFLYIPLPPIGEDESVRCACCGANREQANYHAYLPKLRLAGHIPLPPLPPDRDRSGAVVYETPVDVRYSAVVSHKDPIEARALRLSEGLPRAQATVPSRFISDRSQVTEPVFLANGRRRTDERHHRPTFTVPPGHNWDTWQWTGRRRNVRYHVCFIFESFLQREDRNLLRMLVTIDGKRTDPRHHHANFAKRHGCVTHA
ncbi:hypothetical protein BU17DRAFT_67678 [Hysterangium stoloniferum]|nr:hypothetical protein BU17DRAFT_67678 [Hysterangium stoloniferum]